MKPVILITSCMYHLVRNEQCRATWLAQWSHLIDYRFILGQGYYPKFEDELVLPVDDTYSGLPAKIQASHKWALEQGYDFILKTDCDVYMHIPRLLESGFEKYPYSGNIFWPEARHKFAIGAAYWLNKEASEILVNEPLPPYGMDGGDDMWVGRVMNAHNISCHHESRYYIGENPNYDTFITLHTSGPPKLNMMDIHQKCVQ